MSGGAAVALRLQDILLRFLSARHVCLPDEVPLVLQNKGPEMLCWVHPWWWGDDLDDLQLLRVLADCWLDCLRRAVLLPDWKELVETVVRVLAVMARYDEAAVLVPGGQKDFAGLVLMVPLVVWGPVAEIRSVPVATRQSRGARRGLSGAYAPIARTCGFQHRTRGHAAHRRGRCTTELPWVFRSSVSHSRAGVF